MKDRVYRGLLWNFTKYRASTSLWSLRKIDPYRRSTLLTSAYSLIVRVTPWYTLKYNRDHIIDDIIPRIKGEYVSRDGLPWELHMIRDEAAYRLALASALKNAV